MKNVRAVILAFMAALFYAVNIPVSKILLSHVGPATMAALLYLGAGTGVGLLYLTGYGRNSKNIPLSKSDLPFVVGMVLLDIAAPLFMMIGITLGHSSNASLLGNFEIVATTIIALLLFHEKISRRLWGAIALITLSSLILSFDGNSSLSFSMGSLFVLLATICWGLENNCTRKISSKNTFQIVIIKGLFSGLGGLLIAMLRHESIPEFKFIVYALVLGFIAYGISIFMYVRAQYTLGAAKTSAYYSVAPFVGAFLSFVFLGEKLSWVFVVSLIIMISGTYLVVRDTLLWNHTHRHTHVFTHTHDGSTHQHTVEHSHGHDHMINEKIHIHVHPLAELENNMH